MSKKTKFCSWKTGKLSEGCKQCVKGLKSVLFITGLCSKNCYYCPISEQKKNKDVIFINERPVIEDKDIIDEIKLCGSTGVGITGGDPLVQINRCIKYIELLKKEFGSGFHIHLYTVLELVDADKLEKLKNAGLDELRFHIFYDDSFKKIDLALKYGFDLGVEIPVIPDKEKEIKNIIDNIGSKIKFLNLNELEFSDTNCNEMFANKFEPKDEYSYATKGSEKLGLKLLNYCERKKMNVHYCTVRLKDSVQLKNRIKRRALNIRKHYEDVTKDGMIKHGVVYCDDLNKVKKELINFDVKEFYFDNNKKRIVMSVSDVKKLKGKLKHKIAIVEEYPTYDGLEVEVEFL